MVATVAVTAESLFWTYGQDSLVFNKLIYDSTTTNITLDTEEVVVEESSSSEECDSPRKKARTITYQPSSGLITTLPTTIIQEDLIELVPDIEHDIDIDIEQAWVSSLLDSDRNLLGTIELSFMDEEDESLMLGALPEELIVRESYNISLWQFLRMDPSTPLCFVKFVEADCDGATFRSSLWQSRQSAVLELPNGWEMHLVAESADADQPLTGFLCPAHLPQLLAQREMDKLLESRKLAAAIDIDDTLVKSISAEESCNYSPERVKTLKNMPVTIALASYAEEFLRYASKKYKLCLYSLGTQDYVREVAEILDPHHKMLDWDSITSGISSARHEHDEGKELSPKRLERVFSFANHEDGDVDYSMCLAVDDNPNAWAGKCRKRVLRVISGLDNAGEWDSNLREVLHKMEKYHKKFYKKLNKNKTQNQPTTNHKRKRDVQQKPRGADDDGDGDGDGDGDDDDDEEDGCECEYVNNSFSGSEEDVEVKCNILLQEDSGSSGGEEEMMMISASTSVTTPTNSTTLLTPINSNSN